MTQVEALVKVLSEVGWADLVSFPTEDDPADDREIIVDVPKLAERLIQRHVAVEIPPMDVMHINQETGRLIRALCSLYVENSFSSDPDGSIGFLVRRGLRSAIRSLLPGTQTNLEVETRVQTMHEAFNRYLRGS